MLSDGLLRSTAPPLHRSTAPLLHPPSFVERSATVQHASSVPSSHLEAVVYCLLHVLTTYNINIPVRLDF